MRRVFYSFHYQADNWRAAQVRNMGVIEGNQPAGDNDWEGIKGGGDRAIEYWIANQMHGRSCTVVLVGAQTAERRWIEHEIVESWNKGMGVVGIYIHGLQIPSQGISPQGKNPFTYIKHNKSGRPLSSVVKCYDPPGPNSQIRYTWIRANLVVAVEEAIEIRRRH